MTEEIDQVAFEENGRERAVMTSIVCDPTPPGTDRVSAIWGASKALQQMRATEPHRAPVVDAAHLARQREWSSKTFGPGSRLLGILDHIRKELLEIEADPSDLGEWVDGIILMCDGAWRAGHEPQAIIDAVKAKQARNEAREWPDWQTADPDKAIEHVRTDCLLCGHELTCPVHASEMSPNREALPCDCDYYVRRLHQPKVYTAEGSA